MIPVKVELIIVPAGSDAIWLLTDGVILSVAVFQAERRISVSTGLAREPKCTTTCQRVSLTGPQPARMIGNTMAKARYHYNIMLRPEPEGGYTALVPALPGCVTYGRTVDEAREMAKDAISGYIASLRKHSDPIPSAS
jgi:antitoxin HicB